MKYSAAKVKSIITKAIKESGSQDIFAFHMGVTSQTIRTLLQGDPPRMATFEKLLVATGKKPNAFFE